VIWKIIVCCGLLVELEDYDHVSFWFILVITEIQNIIALFVLYLSIFRTLFTSKYFNDLTHFYSNSLLLYNCGQNKLKYWKLKRINKYNINKYFYLSVQIIKEKTLFLNTNPCFLILSFWKDNLKKKWRYKASRTWLKPKPCIKINDQDIMLIYWILRRWITVKFRSTWK